MAFSDQLRKLRQNQGLSQEQLADLVGATTQEVVRCEIGLARPERDKVLRLARLLGCKPEELLPEEDALIFRRFFHGRFFFRRQCLAAGASRR